MLKRRLPPLAFAALAASIAMGPACHCGSASIRSQAPQIDVQPPAIVITPVPVGHTATVQVQVRNAGNADLHLAKDPQLSESDADGAVEYFVAAALTKDCTGAARAAEGHLTLLPGECALVTLRYTPVNVDADPGVLRFTSDDPNRGDLPVPISLGPPAALKVCSLKTDGSNDACDAADGTPPTIDFGLSALGASALKTVRLQNVGQVRVDISGIKDPAGANQADFRRDSGTAPAFLDPGAKADLVYRFVPGNHGQRTATLEIDSTDSTRDPLLVPLAGRGEGPALCADPQPVDFGQVPLGQKVDKTLVLKSCGTVPVQLQQIAWDTFSNPSFTNSATFPGPQTLQPGAQVTVALRWTPEEAGPVIGQLNVPNDGNPNQWVDLKGTGVVVPACRLSASVQQVDFGQVARGSTAQRDVSVANRGTLNCNLSKALISLGTAYYSVINAPATTLVLRPNDSTTVTVRYAPPANDTNASDGGKLTFQSDDPINPNLDVDLVGHPAAAPVCKLQIVPAVGGIPPFGGRTLVFGNVIVGHDKTLAVTFKNTGSAACNLSAIKFVSQFGLPIPGTPGANCQAQDCDDFHIVSPAAATTLQPGQSTAVNIKFSPTGTAQLPLGPQDFLQITTNDQSIGASTPECIYGIPPNANPGCVQVGMSGQGDVSNLQVLPGDLDFGLTTLGCKAQTQTVTLYNTGTTATINVKSITLNPTTAPFYVVAPPTPFAMAPGAQVKIQVTYRPTGAIRETAQLLIENDASNTSSNNPYVTVGLAGTGTTDKHQKDTFTQATLPKVDLLWVMDNSGSMSQYQSQISNQAHAFICAAKKDPNACTTSDWKADFHIGVSTTEVEQTDSADSSSAYPGDKIYVGGLFGRPQILDNTTPNAIDAFAKNIKVGTCCSDSRESEAESFWRVLTPNANQNPPPQGSKGFLRDDARLVLVAVTDERDQSHNNTAFYVDFFQQVKGRYNAGQVSFNAITGDKTNGCSANGITAEANDFDVDIVSKTGGQFWSLCSADWGKIAGDLTLDAFNGRKQFPLTRVADPATLVVTLNGGAQNNPNDYTFDQPSNSVVFKVAPPPGAVIVAEYDAICF